MLNGRSDKPAPTRADGYRSIPALEPPKTPEEIAAIVRDERAERDARAEHAARALAKLRDSADDSPPRRRS